MAQPVLRGTRDPHALTQALRETPDRLAATVRGLGDAALDRTPAPGEWPVRTVLAHLRDDEFMCTRLRVERILVEDEPALVPFDEQPGLPGDGGVTTAVTPSLRGSGCSARPRLRSWSG